MKRGLGIRNYRSAGGFSPLSLFAGGVNGAWYDPSDATTLFSDRAGTTPCATPGAGAVVPVGAMLDKRASGYSVFFNGTTDSLTTPDSAAFNLAAGDWTIEAWVYSTATGAFQVIGGQSDVGASSLEYSAVLRKTSGNKLQVTIGGSPGSPPFNATSSADLPLNAWTHVAAVRNGNAATLYINGAADGTVNLTGITVNNSTGSFAVGKFGSANLQYWTGYISNFRFVVGTAVYTGNFTPPTSPLSPITGTSLLTCGTSWSGNPAITKNGDARVDGLNPFLASPVGNHAIAANDTTARPELSARVNLLTRTEEFENAAWAKDQATAANTTATTDPLGGTTADILTATAPGTGSYVYQTAPTTAGVVTFSAYVKANTANVFWLYYLSGAAQGVAYFGTDQTTQAVAGTNQTPQNLTITSVGNGWFRISAQWTFAAGTQNYGIGISNAKGSATITVGNSGYIWGADLRPTNIGSQIPAYQRVADQYTYDSTGFPRRLVFNGTSSAMSTPANLNLSATDKATVFAGVRRNATTTQFPVEFSSSSDANNGSFGIGGDSGGFEYFFKSRGTAFRQIDIDNAAYNAPVSNVVTLSTDIAAPSLIARINATQVGSNTSSQGTGNFGSYPLYIGSRANSIYFLNGDIYSLIVVGSAVSAGNITATETWVNGKTGGVY